MSLRTDLEKSVTLFNTKFIGLVNLVKARLRNEVGDRIHRGVTLAKNLDRYILIKRAGPYLKQYEHLIVGRCGLSLSPEEVREQVKASAVSSKEEDILETFTLVRGEFAKMTADDQAHIYCELGEMLSAYSRFVAECGGGASADAK